MPRSQRSTLLSLGCVAICAALASCRSLDKSPVSQSVVQCRQLTQQGVNAMERGDWRRAESLLEQAVATNADDLDARRNYAEALWHRGARAEALAQLEEARKLVPCEPGLTVRTGEVYLEMGQINLATQMVDAALRVDPKFAPAWALRGRVTRATGHPREALADFQRSLGYAPGDYQVSLLVAETYRQLNEPEQAFVALQTLADRYPPGEAPQQVLHLEGLALSAQTRYEDAARVLSEATQRQDPNPDLLCDLAQAELMAGRVPRAQYALQQALTLDPNHAASQALSLRIATAGQSLVR
jgi:tetratricopeptide (TPR) repeat protein